MTREIYEVGLKPMGEVSEKRLIFSHISENGSDYWEVGRSDKIKTKRLYGGAVVSEDKWNKIKRSCEANTGKCHTRKDLTKFVDSILSFAKSEHLEEFPEGNSILYVDLKANVNFKGPILEHRTEN